MRLPPLVFLAAFLFHPPAHADNAAETEQRIQTKLHQLTEKILPEDRYLVQVGVRGDTRMEREVVEGESVTNNSVASSLPSLPGFNVKPPAATGGGGTTRQIFRTKEKFILEGFSVHLLVDQSLSDDLVKRAVEVTNDYLKLEYAGKFTFNTSRAPLVVAKSSGSLSDLLIRYLPWALAAVCFVGLLLAARALRNRRTELPSAKANEIFPEVLQPKPIDAAKELPQSLAMGAPQAQLPPPAAAMDAGAGFPPLPATESFTDRRVELLDEFLQSAEIFRMYFLKLSEGSRAELYSGLRGPAFDSLLETLALPIPNDNFPALSPTDDQISFYTKNFREFLKSFGWQEKQFFGFLHHLDDSQVVKLAQQQNTLVTAVILNFLGPERSAKVLDRLSGEKRLGAIAQLDRCRQLPIEELREMEKVVRVLADEMPRLGAFQQNIDTKFWSRLLSRAENQDQILMDLEQVMPELYPKLAKYRFKLEDLPMLPKALIHRTLDEVNNEELAAALVGVEPSLLEFVLNQLSTERRGFVENQVLVNQGMPPAIAEEQRNALTRRFREVMA